MTKYSDQCICRQTTNGNWRGYYVDKFGNRKVLPLVGGFESLQDACMAIAIYYPQYFKNVPYVNFADD